MRNEELQKDMENGEKDKVLVISSERENQYSRWVNPVHFFIDALEQDISLTFDMTGYFKSQW